MSMSRKLNRASIVSIVLPLFFGVLGWIYSQATPLLETPDEPSHFEVAAYLATHRRLPSMPEHFRTGVAPTVSSGLPYYYAPPLYYVLSALLVGDADTKGFVTAVIPNPNFDREQHISNGLDLSSKNMYVHTADQRPPYADWATAFRRVRLFSLLLGAATVAGCIQLTSMLWPPATHWRWRWAAMSLVAFNPTFLYVSGGVSNDTLLVAISTWSIVLMVQILNTRTVKDGKIIVFGWREGALALFLGMGALTKQSALMLWPLAGLTLVLTARQWAWHRRRLVTTLLLMGIIGSVVGGWWYLQNWLRYSDPLALSAHTPLPPAENVADQFLFLLAQSRSAFRSYWAAFGWATIFVHPAWYVFWGTLTMGGLAGWLLPVSSRDKNDSLWPGKTPLLLWTAVFLNGLFMAIWLWRTAAPYGRLLFPIIAPLACLIVEGWRRWFLIVPAWSPRIVRLWQTAVPAAIITLALVVPVRYLQPAFATLIATPDELAQAVPAQIRFGNVYRLVGYTYAPQQPKSGQPIELSLFWQLDRPPDHADNLDVSVQLALRDPKKRVASIDTLLGAPRYPSSIWRSGETIHQRFILPVPQDAPAPALYWFNVGVYNAQTNEHLPADLAGQPLPGEMVRIGPITITADTDNTPDPLYATRYEFDNAISLRGYDVTLSPDETNMQVVLYWQAFASPAVDWTVFIHLLDDEGQLVTQHDAQPAAGNYPTDWWQPGDQVTDTHTLTLPDSKNLSGYTLQVGLYNLLNGQRAVVVDSQQQQILENAILLEIR